MMTAILRPAPAPSKPAPELAKCPTCDHGRCKPGMNCEACRAMERRERAIRARHRRQELIGRLARVAGCRPAELVELLAEIGLQAQGGGA